MVVQSCGDADHVADIRRMLDPAVHELHVIEHDATCAHDEGVVTHRRENAGRDYGAHVWFVVQFYESLRGRYVFASANLRKHRRRQRLRQRLAVGFRPAPLAHRSHRAVRRADYDYACDSYATHRGQRALTPAAPRPFGRWFEAHVAPMSLFYQSGEYSNGFALTDADTLRARPRCFWQGLLEQLRVSNAPEVGHYVEKASTFLFHPTCDAAQMRAAVDAKGWWAGRINVAMTCPLDLGKRTTLLDGRAGYNVRNRKEVARFLLAHAAIRDVVTAYLQTDRVELFFAQDIQIDAGPQPMQHLHRDHRLGPRRSVAVAMSREGDDVGTCFASGTHVDEDDDAPCAADAVEASHGNLVIFDPYMWHAGGCVPASADARARRGRLFAYFVPADAPWKRELRDAIV